MFSVTFDAPGVLTVFIRPGGRVQLVDVAADGAPIVPPPRPIRRIVPTPKKPSPPPPPPPKKRVFDDDDVGGGDDAPPAPPPVRRSTRATTRKNSAAAAPPIIRHPRRAATKRFATPAAAAAAEPEEIELGGDDEDLRDAEEDDDIEDATSDDDSFDADAYAAGAEREYRRQSRARNDRMTSSREAYAQFFELVARCVHSSGFQDRVIAHESHAYDRFHTNADERTWNEAGELCRKLLRSEAWSHEVACGKDGAERQSFYSLLKRYPLLDIDTVEPREGVCDACGRARTLSRRVGFRGRPYSRGYLRFERPLLVLYEEQTNPTREQGLFCGSDSAREHVTKLPRSRVGLV